jgi:hypothetical protein
MEPALESASVCNTSYFRHLTEHARLQVTKFSQQYNQLKALHAQLLL